MKVCILTKSEAVLLERDSIVPECTNHRHMSFPLALEKVSSDEFRWIAAPGDTTNRRVAESTVIDKWCKRPSIIRNQKGGIEGVVFTMQCVGK